MIKLTILYIIQYTIYNIITDNTKLFCIICDNNDNILRKSSAYRTFWEGGANSPPGENKFNNFDFSVNFYDNGQNTARIDIISTLFVRVSYT